MSDAIKDLDAVANWLRKMSKRFPNPQTREEAKRLVGTVDAAISEVSGLRKKAGPLPSRLGDLSDLPPEVRAELSNVEVDELEAQLLEVIKSYEGTADLNQIIVGLFRKFGTVQKRRFVQQKLWRMTVDGTLYSVPKKKGVYTTIAPTPF
jgi:hypothetical protein